MNSIRDEENGTIAAIATPAGEGAVGIVRLSGSEALSIGERVFRGKQRLINALSHTVHHGFVVDAGGERIDEVLATVFRAPHSYTGEDVVEFGCHGGQLVTSEVLRAALAAGARSAAPGEFTRRAFLNGKMDLSQAEAVADLIAARSSRARRISLEQLEGRLAGAVRELKKQLLDVCSLLELDLDFSEEDLRVITPEEIERRLLGVDTRLDTMQGTFQLGRLLRDGVSVVIAGKPNAGKSSLFNALLKEERAIVTHVPGTTRDSLQESIAIHGVQFKLTDTAGLRETDDIVEAEGVARSKAALRHADIIVFVVDGSEDLAEQVVLPDGLHPAGDQHLIVVLNKLDLLANREANKRRESPITGKKMLGLSAKTGEGLEAFRQALFDMVVQERLGADEPVQITSVRHMDALTKARRSLATAIESLKSGLTNEFIAFDVRVAVQALEEITGEVSSEDILNHIFGKFCVGK